ncbi:MAG: rRNA adenine dimethylase [Betaproteobacteria bacterium RIFCSPLOWO2_12_FULL_63_13]|nr:MAG: rRNA adenine dimethylase [Betaproteobacteria bacterium RIFCSPLOWO2_02_FULL_63_19]OGA47383.1 MAG: rRNA adenine dimethylase [Betaproteobacteria bacterium RIFCSPLOWO2_12_FULL_63_13]
MDDLNTTIRKLVAANRILAMEGVVDAFGHISVRHPDNPNRYLMSRSRSPELVDASDIMEFDMNSDPIDAKGRQPYLERFIHGAVLHARKDVHSVVHNHSYELIPFGVTQVPLRPIFHSAGRIGAHVPVWDIREKFGDTKMLVENNDHGRDLVATLGSDTVVLMRGHGCAVTAASIEDVVLTSIYLRVNARLQMDAMRMGEVTYLSAGEVALNSQLNKPKVGNARAWEYLCTRARVDA